MKAKQVSYDTKKRMIFLELNELNFEVVKSYIDSGLRLPHFEKLLQIGLKRTSSEDKYENIEPWIQWPSIHTGLPFREHEVFRLGDMVNNQIPQIFEIVESHGHTVCCISPMNARNELKSGSVFVPDPWTNTHVTGAWYLHLLYSAIRQAVNDNSENKITSYSKLKLLLGALFAINPRYYKVLFKHFRELKDAGYKRAIFLDILLACVFLSSFQRSKADFGVVFLNGLAHIQHHYFHSIEVQETTAFRNPQWYISSGADPLQFALKFYDFILGELMSNGDISLLVATGLSQEPYDQPIYYYRLKRHADFLRKAQVHFVSVEPRMTRDFLIHFENNGDRDAAISKLKLLKIDGEPCFGTMDIREKSLFVEFTYGKEITSQSVIQSQANDLEIDVCEETVFVALKNGHHTSEGYLVASDPNILSKFRDTDHVSSIFQLIANNFNIELS